MFRNNFIAIFISNLLHCTFLHSANSFGKIWYWNMSREFQTFARLSKISSLHWSEHLTGQTYESALMWTLSYLQTCKMTNIKLQEKCKNLKLRKQNGFERFVFKIKTCIIFLPNLQKQSLIPAHHIRLALASSSSKDRANHLRKRKQNRAS